MRRARGRWQPFKKPGESPVKDRCGPTRKARYGSRDGAEAALLDLRAQAADDDARREQRSYFCDQCAGFHLTSQEARYR